MYDLHFFLAKSLRLWFTLFMVNFSILNVLDLDIQEQAAQALSSKVLEQLTPSFSHDCPCCQFLGHFKGADLYACEGGKTVVAREGNYGPNYVSGLQFAREGTKLGEADRRRRALGIKF